MFNLIWIFHKCYCWTMLLLCILCCLSSSLSNCMTVSNLLLGFGDHFTDAYFILGNRGTFTVQCSSHLHNPLLYISSVSFQLLMPSHVYNRKGQIVNVAYLYYSGTIDMTSKSYLPYLMLALLMSFVFNILSLPLLLVALYPFIHFQKFLDCCFSGCIKYKISLQIFMDVFHGCYKVDTSHDYWHFATSYNVIALRFFNLLLYTVFNFTLYFNMASILLVFTLALVAKFQPNKCKQCNTTVTLFCMLHMQCEWSRPQFQLMFPRWHW